MEDRKEKEKEVHRKVNNFAGKSSTGDESVSPELPHFFNKIPCTVICTETLVKCYSQMRKTAG